MRMKILATRFFKAIVPYGIIISRKRREERKTDPRYLYEKRVAIFPRVAPGANEYIDLMKAAIVDAGYSLADTPDEAEVIWLHWYENNLDDKNFSKKIAKMREWQIQGRKVVYHIHNKSPHENTDSTLVNTFMGTALRIANHISYISSETRNVLSKDWQFGGTLRGVSDIPHPNYIDVYGAKIEEIQTPNDTLRLLFFGLVRPYKGLEHLLEATKNIKNIEIGVYGKAPDFSYKLAIENLCKDRKDVKLELRHIDDNEIPEIFSRYHVIVAPHNLDSSLNSGSTLLAFSYGRTVVGTNNGTLKDINDDFYFPYEYTDDADHTKQLKKILISIQKQYDGKYNELLKLGERGYRYVAANNSVDAVMLALKKMFWRINK